jgi:hypothetical protein
MPASETPTNNARTALSSPRAKRWRVVCDCEFMALFRLPQNSKLFYSFSITSIFRHMHGALNVGKK